MKKKTFASSQKYEHFETLRILSKRTNELQNAQIDKKLMNQTIHEETDKETMVFFGDDEKLAQTLQTLAADKTLTSGFVWARPANSNRKISSSEYEVNTEDKIDIASFFETLKNEGNLPSTVLFNLNNKSSHDIIEFTCVEFTRYEIIRNGFSRNELTCDEFTANH